MQKWIIVFVVILVIILSVFIVFKVNVETEYIPESEVSEEELRKTIIVLFYKSKETGDLVKETRLVDSKELLLNPYEKIIRLLLDGPENDSNERLIPENVKVLEVKFNNGYVEINFSKELSEHEYDENTLTLMFNSIYNTLKELTEVNGVKILSDGTSVIQIPYN